MSAKLSTPDFSGFPPHSRVDWEQAALRELKGKPLSSLDWEWEDGMRTGPWFDHDSAPAWKPVGSPAWHRGTFFFSPDRDSYKVADQLLSDDPDLHFVWDVHESENGLRFPSRNFRLATDRSPEKWIDILAQPACEGMLFDVFGPVFRFGRRGDFFSSQHVWEAFRKTGKRFVDINLVFPQLCGATQSELLALAFSMAADTVDVLTSCGWSARESLDAITFTFPLGTQFFTDVALLRAFRLAWPQFAGAYTAVDAVPFVHAVTSPDQLSLTDTHTNLLRTTTSALAAVTGGADLVSVMPFRHDKGVQAYYPQRLARNIQLLLQEESSLGKVNDPWGGSYFVESFTRHLLDTGWEKFRQIETDGGLISTLKKGILQGGMLDHADRNFLRVVRREKTWVGVNDFPSGPDEFMIDPPHPFPQPEDAWSEEEMFVHPLMQRDGKAAIEGSRLRMEEWIRDHHARPRAFLWTWGDVTMRIARANFSRNLLGLAGIVSDENPDPDHEVRLSERKPAPDIIVFCSSDDQYLQDGLERIARAKTACPDALLILAGKPSDEAPFLEAGITHFIYRKMNALNFLENLSFLIHKRSDKA